MARTFLSMLTALPLPLGAAMSAGEGREQQNGGEEAGRGDVQVQEGTGLVAAESSLPSQTQPHSTGPSRPVPAI